MYNQRKDQLSNQDNEGRCLQLLLKNNYDNIIKLPLIKEFLKDGENQKLFNRSRETNNSNMIKKLNLSFQNFFKLQKAKNYAIGIIKRYPIDYDKRVKKRNSRCLLILDKPIKNTDYSSNTSYLELIGNIEQNEDDPFNDIFKDSIFKIKNEKLKKAVNSLKPKQKTILKLIYEGNYTQREISNIVGQTEQNIHYWHKKTLKEIQNVLTV